MVNLIMIIVAGVFAAGIGVGTIAVVSVGIQREERRFRELQRLREEHFFQTGEVLPGYVPVDAPDHVAWGARRVTGLWVRRWPTVAGQTADEDLLIR
jgi:hypothetical protein